MIAQYGVVAAFFDVFEHLTELRPYLRRFGTNALFYDVDDIDSQPLGCVHIVRFLILNTPLLLLIPSCAFTAALNKAELGNI